MVRVVLWGSLNKFADNREYYEVEAKTIIELLRWLGKEYPKLKPTLDRGVAVAIEGTLYQDNWFQPIPPDSEVYVLPRLAGG